MWGRFLVFSQATLRKGLLIIHLWLGLFLGLYFSVVGVTGSVLVFQDNLQSRLTPEIAYCAPPSPNAPLLPLSSIITQFRASSLHPTDADLASVLMPDQPGGAYRFRLNLRDADARRVVTVNPYNGEMIRNQLQSATLLGFAHNLHVFLLIGAPGELANGIGGILVAFLLISGLWLWWPKTRRQLRARLTVQRKAGAKRLIADLHHVFGIYSFLLLLIIAITGALFVFPQPVKAIVARIGGPSISRKPPKVTALAGTTRMPIEKLVAIAEPIDPDIKISSVYYPAEADQPFSCYKRSFAPGFFPYINITIDPYTGKVLKVVDDRTSPLAAKIPRFLSQIHFGLWGGLLMKTVYALVGLMPVSLFVTGVLMWLRKKRSSRERNIPFRAEAA